jgi:hypothetical protein
VANALLTGTVLYRRGPITFTPKPKPGEPPEGPVTFYEAVIYDEKAAQLSLFRSRERDDFSALEPGKPVKDFACRADSPVPVMVPLFRPARAEGCAKTF